MLLSKEQLLKFLNDCDTDSFDFMMEIVSPSEIYYEPKVTNHGLEPNYLLPIPSLSKYKINIQFTGNIHKPVQNLTSTSFTDTENQ